MEKYNIQAKGNTVLEIVNNLIQANAALNRQVNTVLFSEETAWRLASELKLTPPKDYAGKLFTLDHLKGAILLGLDVMIIKHKSSDFIDVVEVL